MPNWCENSLEIVALDKKGVHKIRELKEKAANPEDPHDDVFQMKRFVPRPKDAEEIWYAWNCANWGTKWDVCEQFIEDYDIDSEEYGRVVFSFLTAWSPPEIFVEKLAKMYPELNFFLRYEEPGMGYSGILRMSNGEIKTQKTIEWYDE
jgi:hypothetical protein